MPKMIHKRNVLTMFDATSNNDNALFTAVQIQESRR